MVFGLGRNADRRARKKAWKEEVERGKRIRKAQLTEIKRRKAEETARKAEAKRQTEIERLKKKTELLKAQYTEREAVARRKRASREARRGLYFGPPPRPKIPKAVTRKRGKKAKIGWF